MRLSRFHRDWQLDVTFPCSGFYQKSLFRLLLFFLALLLKWDELGIVKLDKLRMVAPLRQNVGLA